MYRITSIALILATLTWAAAGVSAREGTLLLWVTNLEDTPIPGLQITPTGRGSLSDPTTDTGRTRLRLDPEVTVGEQVSLGLTSAGSQEWVLINRQVPVPAWDETEPVHIVLMKRTAFRAVVTGALDAVSRTEAIKDKISEAERRQIIAEFAAEHGLSEEQLAQAIRSFAETEDPLDQGIAALVAGKYLQAEELLRTSLETGKARVVESAKYLGQSLRAQGRYREAVEVYRLALANQPEDRGLLTALGCSLRQNGEFIESERTLRRSLELAEDELGSEHRDTLMIMGTLAMTLRNLGDLKGARELQEQILEVFREEAGPEHAVTLAVMGGLAVTLQAQGELSRARELEEQVLEVRRRVLGEEHPDTLTAMGNLAVTLQDLGELSRARELQEHVLEVFRRVLGEEHPDTLTAMNNLAVALYEQRDFTGARQFEERVFELRRETLGENHPDTLAAKRTLALTYNALCTQLRVQKKFDEAIASCYQAIKLDPDLMEAYAGVEEVYRAQSEQKQ